MQKDVDFLNSFYIMDYSLLFAIEQNPRYRSAGGHSSTRGGDNEQDEANIDIDLDALDEEQFTE